MAKKKMYVIRGDKYDPTWIKAVAMAIHLDKLDPAELEFWYENNWTQEEMAKELYKRITGD